MFPPTAFRPQAAATSFAVAVTLALLTLAAPALAQPNAPPQPEISDHTLKLRIDAPSPAGRQAARMLEVVAN